MEKTLKDQLLGLKEGGLKFSDCIEVFGVDENNPFAKAASENYSVEGDIEIDSTTVLSESNEGAYVMAWVWVSNEDAGILSNVEVLEELWKAATSAIQGNSDPDRRVRQIYCDWLEDLITNFADEVDGIADAEVTQLPGCIAWLDEDMVEHQFMPSTAISSLAQMAIVASGPSDSGLKRDVYDQVVAFVAKFGNKLDAVLKVATISLEDRTALK